MMTKKIAVAGGSLDCVLLGDGKPTIVLMSGHRTPLSSWQALLAQAPSSPGKPLAYDHFGSGGCDQATTAQDGNTIIETLRELLESLDLPGPYLLVAHSLGGLYANLFARRYPASVAGIVFVESGHPQEAGQPKDSLGFMRRFLEKVSNLFQPAFKLDQCSEYNGVPATVSQITQAPNFPNIPIAVITGGKRMPFVPNAVFENHQQ